MKNSKDEVLKNLVKKKKELLQNLQLQAQRFAIDGGENLGEEWVEKRKSNLTLLMLNDEIIAQRERQTGRKAEVQEAELFAEIASLAEHIFENNQMAIDRLESAKVGLENDRKQLKKENQLAGYLQSKKVPARKAPSKPRPMQGSLVYGIHNKGASHEAYRSASAK